MSLGVNDTRYHGITFGYNRGRRLYLIPITAKNAVYCINEEALLRIVEFAYDNDLGRFAADRFPVGK